MARSCSFILCSLKQLLLPVGLYQGLQRHRLRQRRAEQYEALKRWPHAFRHQLVSAIVYSYSYIIHTLKGRNFASNSCTVPRSHRVTVTLTHTVTLTR